MDSEKKLIEELSEEKGPSIKSKILNHWDQIQECLEQGYEYSRVYKLCVKRNYFNCGYPYFVEVIRQKEGRPLVRKKGGKDSADGGETSKIKNGNEDVIRDEDQTVRAGVGGTDKSEDAEVGDGMSEVADGDSDEKNNSKSVADEGHAPLEKSGASKPLESGKFDKDSDEDPDSLL